MTADSELPNNEPAIRQLKLASNEEIICYVGESQKGVLEISYPMQTLQHLDAEMFMLRPWWSTESPFTTCLLNTSHIVATLIPSTSDILTYQSALSTLEESYNALNEESEEVSPDQLH